MYKYPRTPHIEGSRLQPGDEDMSEIPFSLLRGRYVVVEEKLDGANSGISFSPGGELLLQSRGHYLTGGAREKHFNLFKSWAATHSAALHAALGDRFVMYGEWLYAKHTIFYDALPHYFVEFDILDTEANEFLSTARREEMLAGLPISRAPVLAEGLAESLPALGEMLKTSLYKSPRWRDRVGELASELGLDRERVWRETDPADEAEGLYLKVEEGGRVVERYKYIRQSFLTAVVDSGSHWLSRPIVPNQLAPGVDIFARAGQG
jgi:hypothetical protein